MMKDLDLLTHLYAAVLISRDTEDTRYIRTDALTKEARDFAISITKDISNLEKEERIAHAKSTLRSTSKDIDYSKFNLLYHITPMGNWEWNLSQLQRRIHIFGGRRVVTVAQGSGIPKVPANQIYPYFDSRVMIIEVPNNIETRETEAFLKGLEAASGFDRDGYTFYAHTKGVTRGENLAVKLWTAGLYHYNLDYLDLIVETLKDHPVAGSFRRLGRFVGFPARSLWHYSGTFFWFRNKDLFAKPNWKDVPHSKYGTEAYLSLLFKQKEAGLLWWNKVGDLYDLNYLKNLYGPELGMVEAHAEV